MIPHIYSGKLLKDKNLIEFEGNLDDETDFEGNLDDKTFAGFPNTTTSLTSF